MKKAEIIKEIDGVITLLEMNAKERKVYFEDTLKRNLTESDYSEAFMIGWVTGSLNGLKKKVASSR